MKQKEQNETGPFPRTPKGGGTLALNWWTEPLSEVLAQFTAVYDGSVNVKFWNCFCKRPGGSGGENVCGWINTFFPYITERSGNDKYKLNTSLQWDSVSFRGPMPSQYLPSLGVAPITWKYYSQTFQLQAYAGMYGYTQDPQTHTVRPHAGVWLENQGVKT